MPANTNTDLRNGVNGDVGCKYPCDCATTADITLEGLQTIDGIAGVDSQTIVLVKDQTDQSQNGVYVQSTGEWQRGVWFNNELNVAPGTLVVVNGGSTNARTIWETVCADNPIDFDTSDITFELKVKGTNTGDKSIALTGPVTGTSTESSPGILTVATTITNDAITTAKIADNNVTNAKLAQVATATFKGRTTAGTGNVEDLTATQATALLNNMVGDSGSGGTKGLVPAPAAGDAAAGKFLKADGTFATTPNSSQATELALGTAALATQAKMNTGTDDLTIATPLKITTWYNAKKFQSSQQTITASGTLTIAHGLGSVPKNYAAYLVCTDAGGEYGYVQNDETQALQSDLNTAAAGAGCAIIPDATNLKIQFGSNPNTFYVIKRSSIVGDFGAITNSKWKVIFRASL